jgi:hypothetical protein
MRLQPTRLETEFKQASEYCISIRPIGKVVNGRDPDGKALYTGSYIASDFVVFVLVLSEAVLVLVIENMESSTSTISSSTSTIKAKIVTSSPLAAG